MFRWALLWGATGRRVKRPLDRGRLDYDVAQSSGGGELRDCEGRGGASQSAALSRTADRERSDQRVVQALADVVYTLRGVIEHDPSAAMTTLATFQNVLLVQLPDELPASGVLV